MNEYRCPCGWSATARYPEGIVAAAKDHQERGCEKGERRVREVADNRTNEPTEAQVERAYRAFCEARLGRAMTDEEHEATRSRLELTWIGPTIAAAAERDSALVAAQGAAPQAEAYVHCCNHPKCPGGSLCCCASEQRLRDCWNQWREEVAGDTKQAFRDAYSAGRNDPAPWAVAPVLPSSGVDEDALAEVIAESRGFGNGWTQIPPLTREAYREVARAVAEWLIESGWVTNEP